LFSKEKRTGETWFRTCLLAMTRFVWLLSRKMSNACFKIFSRQTKQDETDLGPDGLPRLSLLLPKGNYYYKYFNFVSSVFIINIIIFFSSFVVIIYKCYYLFSSYVIITNIIILISSYLNIIIIFLFLCLICVDGNNLPDPLNDVPPPLPVLQLHLVAAAASSEADEYAVGGKFIEFEFEFEI
jgi:hypothetical protein